MNKINKYYYSSAVLFGSLICGTNIYNGIKHCNYLRDNNKTRYGSIGYNTTDYMNDCFDVALMSICKGVGYGLGWPIMIPNCILSYKYDGAILKNKSWRRHIVPFYDVHYKSYNSS